MSELSEQEAAMLDFERQRWKAAGARDAAIRDLFGLTPTRYHQLLDALIKRPEALSADPVTVNRLQRLRQRRRPWHAG